MNNKERVRRLIDDLDEKLVDLETLGALVAAAHLDAAIGALAKEFNLDRNISVPD